MLSYRKCMYHLKPDCRFHSAIYRVYNVKTDIRQKWTPKVVTFAIATNQGKWCTCSSRIEIWQNSLQQTSSEHEQTAYGQYRDVIS